MKLHLLKFLPLFVFALVVGSCDRPPTDEELLTSLKKDVYFLAADDLGGRAIGTTGEQKAAEYLAQEFEKLGLIPMGTDGFFQEFTVSKPSNPHEEAVIGTDGAGVTGRNVVAFLDKKADKRDKLIRQLLDREDDFAAHWLSFWNDALRNDYTGPGYITGGRFNITNWLYTSIKTNKPYPQFVKELVDPVKESKGFIEGIKWRGEINASQRTEMQAAQNVAQVFLGLNLKCASCHNSFISDWKLTDAYGFANILHAAIQVRI